MVDAALMTSIPRVEELSFDNVVRQREVQILRTAYRMLGNWSDAEDVAQDVFVRLHKHGLRFPTEAGLYAWLYRVTVNLCVDRVRSAKHWEELPERLSGGGESAELSAIREERKEALMRALAMLAPKERAAVVLREIEGLSTPEVAEILGSTEGTIRSQISKALGHLRRIIEGL